MVMKSLSFFFFRLGKCSPQFYFWRITLPHNVLLLKVLLLFFLLLELWVYHPTFSWPVRFQLRNHWAVLWGLSCMWKVNCLLMLSLLFYVLVFWQFHYNVSLCRLLWIPLICSFWELMNLSVHFPPQIWDFFLSFFLSKLLLRLS